MKGVSEKGKRVKPFLVMQILGIAKDMERMGRDIVHLEIGEPDFDSPEYVVTSAINSLERGETHYTPSEGIHELRVSIVEEMERRYRIRISPERVIITPGTSPAFLLLFLSLFNRGEKVLMTDPSYPCYRNFALLCDVKPVLVRVREEDGWLIDPDILRYHRRRGIRVLIISSPSNPTGAITPISTYEEAKRLGYTIISDEIYHGINFSGERDFSALEIDDSSFVINGVSKFYAMTGFRIGWIIAPEKFIPPLKRLAQNLFLCAPTISQFAAISALESKSGYPNSLVSQYRERRDLLLRLLKEMGFSLKYEPQGAFYAFVDISRFSSDSFDFAMKLLKERGVAIAPGIDFSPSIGKRYVRFSFTTTKERIEEGLRRLRDFIQKGDEKGR